MHIPPVGIDELFSSLDLDILLNAVMTLHREHTGKINSGGVLAMARIDMQDDVGTDYMSRCIGILTSTQLVRYSYNANEKWQRLLKRRKDGASTEFLSRASADPDNADETKRTYPGCVLFLYETSPGLQLYISFSGAHGDVDEAICLILGNKLGFNCPASLNPLIPRAAELLEHVRRMC